MRAIITVLLGAAPALACSHTEGSGPPSHDGIVSEGVVIEAEPVLEIGGPGVTGSAPFEDVRDATRLSNGHVVIADPLQTSLITVDSSGRVLRRVGRQGEGPGEYRSLSWLEQCGVDSLFIWDLNLGRVTVLDSAGTFVRQFRLPGRPFQLHCSRSGLLVFLQGLGFLGVPSAESPVYRTSLILTNGRGESVMSLDSVPIGQNRPLATVTQLALADQLIYVGTGDSAYVAVYGLDGMRQGSLLVGGDPRRPTMRHYERVINGLVSIMRPGEEREFVRRLMLDIPMPEFLPRYTALSVDRLGILWAIVSAPGDGATVLKAIAPNNQTLGEARFPFEMTVFEIGADYVLGAYEAGDGLQHVVMYRLRR